MDEGRLAIVLRQEEQHRKFVYIMNDIVRSRLADYNKCLVREEHEASLKLVKNCVEVRQQGSRCDGCGGFYPLFSYPHP